MWISPITMKAYFIKMKGGAKSPPGVGISEVMWSWLGSVIGIGILGLLIVALLVNNLSKERKYPEYW